MSYCLEGAMLIREAVNKTLKGYHSTNDKKAPRSLAALMLYLLDKLCSVESSEGNSVAIQVAQMKEAVKNGIQALLKQWVVKPGVVGSNVFGGTRRSEAEIKVKLYFIHNDKKAPS